LYKPLPHALGYKDSNKTDETTATTHTLPASYQALQDDGTLGPVITSITLRDGEGAILIPYTGGGGMAPALARGRSGNAGSVATALTVPAGSSSKPASSRPLPPLLRQGGPHLPGPVGRPPGVVLPPGLLEGIVAGSAIASSGPWAHVGVAA